MSGNVGRFVWNKQREAAALLVAEDEFSDLDIAERVGITDRTLYRWKQHPAFVARVQEHVKHFEAAMLRHAIARRGRRVAALQDRWQRMQRVIQARETEYAGVAPGGETGLLVRQLKSIGFGENNQVVEEYAVDTALLRELRAHEEQAAKELGQWVDRKDHTTDGRPLDLAGLVLLARSEGEEKRASS